MSFCFLNCIAARNAFNDNVYIDPHPTHINILIDGKRFIISVEDELHLQRLALNALRAAMQLRKQKANDKISAQNKLKALGLTDAEIEAL